MKKVLFTATIDGHIKVFHTPYMRLLKEMGFEVHVAANGDKVLPYCDYKFNIPFERSPFAKSNYTSYKLLKNIIDKHGYDIIHCHTPVAGAISRIAAMQARKKGTKVIYTAHGFHFYSGAPLKNWLIFYPLEKFLSHYTDVLVTINEEDYRRAVNNNFKAGSIDLVSGVGVDLSRFSKPDEVEKMSIRDSLGLDKDAFILVYPAEISARKNQQMMLEVAHILQRKIPQLCFIFAGRGNWQPLQKIVDGKGLSESVKFIGFTYDIYEYIKASDVGISSSKQEGLPINIIEAMACGKPVVATDVRGNRQLVESNKNGYLVPLNDHKAMAERIFYLFHHREKLEEMSKYAQDHSRRYSLEVTLQELNGIYRKV